MTNTALALVYRSAHRSPVHARIVLQGRIDAGGIQRLRAALTRTGGLIANQVGIPSPRDTLAGLDGFPRPETDHVWTALVAFEDGRTPTVEELETHDDTTVDLGIDEFIRRVASAEWDADSAWFHDAGAPAPTRLSTSGDCLLPRAVALSQWPLCSGELCNEDSYHAA